MPDLTAAQRKRFHDLFKRWTSGATEAERANGERLMDKWLAKNGKTRADITSILAEVHADELKKNPPPPQADPRDVAPNPYDDPRYSPAGLVEGIVSKYVAMSSHALIIFALWICLTHVYMQLGIAPRVALVSENPDSGKSIAGKIARHLVARPNMESLGTGAAIRDFLEEGPGTILLDELDQVDSDARRAHQRIWNLGHERGGSISLMVAGKRKVVNIFAPMLAAGVGSFLAPTQKSRTFTLDMVPYTEESRPERDYNIEVVVEGRTEDLDAVYTFLRHWAERVRAGEVKLNSRPSMPTGMTRRFADNVRGPLAIADSCGAETGQRVREAMMFLLEKENAERPQIVMIRHALVIFDMLEVDQIRSTRLNHELKRLDLPDAKWTRYRGPSGTDYAHPIEMHEQAALLERVGVRSTRIRPPGEKQCHGYKRAQFEEAERKHGSKAPDATGPGRARLRLITPSPE
jgi:Protein of unknown function (DUF3631)